MTGNGHGGPSRAALPAPAEAPVVALLDDDVRALGEEVAALRQHLARVNLALRAATPSRPATTAPFGTVVAPIEPAIGPPKQSSAPAAPAQSVAQNQAPARHVSRFLALVSGALVADGSHRRLVDRAHGVRQRLIGPATRAVANPAWETLDRRWELGFGVALLLIAAFVRLHDLTAIPTGFHGDEAVVGLEARRILAQGSIGPYSPLALGQPTGPIYLSAVSIWLFGESIFAIRLVPALLGTLTVVALYLVLRRAFGARTALTGAALLAVMSWHVQFARVGFPLEAWPLVVVLATGALMEALRSGDWRWWAGAGALTALGTYTYNAHPLWLAIVGLFVLHRLYRWDLLVALAALALYAFAPNGATLVLLALALLLLLVSRRVAAPLPFFRAAAFGLALLVVSIPMIRFAADPDNGYFNHARAYAINNRERATWQALADTPSQVRFLAGRYVDFWDETCCHPRFNGVSASGLTPVVPLPLLLLAAAGAVLAWRRRPHPLLALGILVLLLMPLAAVFTVGGPERRTLAMAPFLALFAALGLSESVRLIARHRARWRYPLGALLVLVAALALVQNLRDYFVTFAESPRQHWVYAEELVDAAAFMRTLPPSSRVYFFSDRWSVNYETRRFLAPNVAGEDRSRQFGRYDLRIDPALGKPVFVFLGPYRTLLPEVSRLYPGGTTVEGQGRKSPTFVAYQPPTSG